MWRSGRDLWLLGVLAVAWVLVLVSAANPGPDARAELAALIERVERRLQVPFVRERALWGEVLAGTANEHYRRAGDGIRRAWDGYQRGRFWDEALWPAAIDDPEVHLLRADVAPAFRALREGAACREVACDDPWPHLGANLVWLECRCLLAEGSIEQAVRLWLDAAACSADGVLVSHRPSDVCWYSNALQALVGSSRGWTPDRLALLPASERAELATGLARIDEPLSRRLDVERFVATAARHVTSAGYYAHARVDLWTRLRAWQCGFSPQQRSIEAVAEAARGLDRLVPAESGWESRVVQLEVFRLRDPEGCISNLLPAAERNLRKALAEVRLLRLALKLAAGAEPEPMDNPLGSRAIAIEEHADAFVLRCIGTDSRVERVVPR